MVSKIYAMSYELTGKLVAKYDTVQRTETFKTREFAVEKSDEINGRTITNYAKFQCVQDKTTIIDRVNIGDEIKVYFDNRLIATLPRLKGSGNAAIRYQDIIGWLVRKPGAFKKYKYFDFLFPTTNFRFAYDFLVKTDHLNATKQYLNILNLASKNESKVESILKIYLQSGENFDYKIIANSVDTPKEQKILIDIKIPSINLNNYDKLLQGSNICQLQN